MSKLYSTNAFTLAPASPQAAAISRLFIGTLIFLAVILALVTFLVIFAVIRYRDRPGAQEATQNFGSRKLEIVWTVAPILSLIVLAIFMVFTMHSGDPAIPDGDPDLRIIAHQWWWEVHYLKSGVVASNEIHIPIGHPLSVELLSADVIHDFWVPELARKMDIVPGRRNSIWLEADHPATYLGACAEFCGAEHAWMRIRVIAQPPDQFDAWLHAQQTLPSPPVSRDALQGAKLFTARTCANCHTVSGTEANGDIGPDLTHVAGRQTLAAGALDNTPGNLLAWLHDPDHFKHGSHMPNLHLSQNDLNALVAYLETLK
ncbi:MAG TPA: cytochrome c oxidase subunit II [Candidatus Binataceae bacterium]|nr:cytochrome c oxidase subunit II [Candidatus Binataceae bacterium]